MITLEELFKKAEQFIRECYTELHKTEKIEERLGQIKKEINRTNEYVHTFEELEHGARMAWRNSNRCIGRLFWPSLQVFDERGVTREDDIFNALCRHIEFATNDGKIRPTITIFHPKQQGRERVRIWNHQLLRFAGYETEHGIIGDPASITLTKELEKMGWKGERTPFDILPLVIQVDENKPRWFPIPEDIVVEVDITHPDIPHFEELQLKWYAVPIISDMKLEIGGIEYTAAPFNGWYMETEIGARNFADEQRYHMLPKVAELLHLDMSKHATLWKDKALIELNIAVLHSFKQKGVSIVDHHTAATQFKRFEEQEVKCGREITGDWIWLIPPISPATTHIFHKPYKNKVVSPNYYYQERPYE